MINRILLDKINNDLFKGKTLVLLGARQTGKTTLLSELSSKTSEPILFLSGDDSDTREMFVEANATKMASIIGNYKLVIIDEAQRIHNIGLSLKIINDNFLKVQVIATGSSAFELTDKINEPLTGRKFEYQLYPFSFEELSNNTSNLVERRSLEQRLIYGSYPEVVVNPDRAKTLLKLLAESFLYKDVLTYERIKKPEKVEKMVQALALQMGSEVNYHEIGKMIGADNETVESYINILEKAFIIFRLTSFSRNKRNELKKSRKLYFYDNGIRNAIINNFNPLSLRQDVGSLWENYLVMERVKYNHYHEVYCNYHFWRTHTQTEIDFIEERDGKLFAFEFKWNPKHRKIRSFQSFALAYPNSQFEVITPENYEGFVNP